MPWAKTGATHYHAQLGLPDKGRAINGLVDCFSSDLEPLDLLNGLALGCYQPSLRYDSYNRHTDFLEIKWLQSVHA